jgi:serine/threonine protein kinase
MDDSKRTIKLAHGKVTIETACLRGYEIKKILGSGNHGTVLLTCLDEQCIYAMKIIILPEIRPECSESDKDTFDIYLKKAQDEIEISKLFSAHGIGPRFIDAWICDNIVLIVSELWDDQLKPGICIEVHLLKKLTDQICKMHALGYVHGDIFEKNILVRYNERGELIDITLADFGTAQPIEEWKRVIFIDPFGVKQSAARMYYNHHIKFRTNYFPKNNITLQKVLDDPRYLDKNTIWSLYQKCNLEMPPC